MKTVFTLFVGALMLISISTFSQTKPTTPSLPNNVSKDWYSDAITYAKQMEYDFYSINSNQYRTTNVANAAGFIINNKGYKAFGLKGTTNGDWQVDMVLQSISRSAICVAVSANNNIKKTSTGLVHAFDFGHVEYINNESGLRQNFIINSRPAGEGNLKVNILTRTTLTKRIINGTKLVFLKGNETVLNYEDLKVWDANNNRLEAHMEWNEKEKVLSLVVNDKNAVYPVTVDPLNKIPEWTTAADGVLTGLLNTTQLQANTLYGYTVANIGDVNNDGYGDAAVGAPGMANVLTGTGTLLGVGAVFIYHGSATGLSTTPSNVLQPSTLVAGASFGFSIAGGSISPDGVSDVIVGAPLDTYQTTIPAIIGNQQVNVPAGSVYYFRSEDLSSTSNTVANETIRLQGGLFFSSGILGLLNNLTVKGLFGYSVSVTEDLNGDNRGDIIVGAPNYTDINLLSAQSGGAFVFYSNALNTTTPVQFSMPTASVLGLVTLPISGLNGLLFGFSVDGLGDYNNDGFPDVVVGAPAGANLSSLGGIFSGQVLGGSAYIYYGNGTGVNTAIGATLQASSSGLLGSAANLFGYRVRGVRGGNGARNGGVLVSAPSGNVLSNVVGGLQLKAGNVHVFRRKTAAFTSPVTSDQALTSPRNAAVTTLLTGQNLNVSMLYGAGTDNMIDANCDGRGDIIVGEPLSSNVPLVGANVTGGAAYIYLGTADGLYQAAPIWTLETTVSALLGVNATSLIGYSVAGGIKTHGINGDFHALIGGPSNSLDFGSGLLNLGNTVGALNNFAFDNGGIGSAYAFNANICGLIPLPSTLTKFDGNVVEKSVILKWTAENEMNVNMYQLQRSIDGSHFENIAMIFAKNEQHNEYNYPDKHPAKGVNYYRLQTVDNDGKTAYSNTITFRFNEQLPGFIVVAPNPVHGAIRVKLAGFDKGDYTIRVYNTNGQIVAMKRINLSQHDQVEEIQRSADLPQGTYWLNLSDREKIVRTVNLVIGD